MGSVCCVAARDEARQNESSSGILHRNVQCSPSWSFQWDNRRRVAGEETSVSWYSDRVSRNDGLENKSETVVETAHQSEAGSPAENFQLLTWAKSPLSEGIAVKRRTVMSDSSISRSISKEVSLEQVKEATESPAESDRSPVKLSPVMSSTPSLSASPLLNPSLTPSRLAHRSPRNPLSRQTSDGLIPGFKSPSNYSIFEERQSPAFPPWSNESTRVSHGGSSDGWSVHGFPEFMAASYRERWSFDSESLGFNHDKLTRSSSRISASPSIDLQTCGVCSKLLSEKSSFSSQKIVVTNDLSVVAVLICGHIYHAECLENMTPEISKYEPPCPICTLGEQKVLKMSEKVLKAEMDSRARKRLRNGDFDALDRRKGSGHEEKGPKMASSSSMKSSFGKPFLKRHFSFRSKGSKSFTESNSTKKKASSGQNLARSDLLPIY